MPIEAKAMELTMFHSMLHLVESAVIPSMQKQKSGYIANILSRARLGGGVSGLAYTAAKHKIVSGKEGTRCNTICPGGITRNPCPGACA